MSSMPEPVLDCWVVYKEGDLITAAPSLVLPVTEMSRAALWEAHFKEVTPGSAKARDLSRPFSDASRTLEYLTNQGQPEAV